MYLIQSNKTIFLWCTTYKYGYQKLQLFIFQPGRNSFFSCSVPPTASVILNYLKLCLNQCLLNFFAQHFFLKKKKNALLPFFPVRSLRTRLSGLTSVHLSLKTLRTSKQFPKPTIELVPFNHFPALSFSIPLLPLKPSSPQSITTSYEKKTYNT